MKILAATPVNYSRPIYIVELDADELCALTVLHPYSQIPVIQADGVASSRDKDKLVSGDVIERTICASAMNDIIALRSSREEILKAFSTIRGAMTKVQNTLPEKV